VYPDPDRSRNASENQIRVFYNNLNTLCNFGGSVSDLDGFELIELLAPDPDPGVQTALKL
jgi:hypothetical protein